MPIYSYVCSGGHESEQMRSIETRDTPDSCKECGKPLTRKIDRPGMVWAPSSSGTGTYKT